MLICLYAYNVLHLGGGGSNPASVLGAHVLPYAYSGLILRSKDVHCKLIAICVGGWHLVQGGPEFCGIGSCLPRDSV